MAMASDTALWRALRPLASCVSFMNSGAHPDDEFTRLLAPLVLRDGLRVSILCSTRGEGGQNALGPETGRDIGVIRTREMERACAELGMALYWLNAGEDDPIHDFGFSKDGDDTLARWGRDHLLRRFASAIRAERPDILCPTFLDVPGQHGHHRAMTRAAPLAIALAADPAFADGQAPWQVAKFYLPAWSGAGTSYDDDLPPPPATVTLRGSGTDPVLGRQYAQLGEESRRWHATQRMGRDLPEGFDNDRPLHLAWSASGVTGPEQAITDGLPTLAGIGLPDAGAAMAEVLAAWPDRGAMRAAAAGAVAALVEVAPEHAHRVAAKRRQLARVLALLDGRGGALRFEPAEARPGGRVRVVTEGAARLVVPAGWTLEGEWLTLPPDAAASVPMGWQPDAANALVHGVVEWEEGGAALSVPVEPEEPLRILPAITARLVPDRAVYNVAAPEPVTIAVAEADPPGQFTLDLPAGWTAEDEGLRLHLSPLSPPREGRLDLPLRLGGMPAAELVRMVYPHTGPLVRAAPAVLRLGVIDVIWPQGRVAYVGGGSDRCDDLLRAAGLEVETLDDAALATADLAGFDAVLVGIFAARTRPGLAARMADIHTRVRQGATLLTLYHPPWDNWDILPLAPVSIGQPSLRWRVTDEAAAVTVLEPDHPVLTAPNRIRPQDWDGWAKERGLYFARDWDPAYRPLIELADPGEAPHRGALISGRFGAGRHSHCALILHHQLAELVPGAYRLMANLLASA